MRTFKSLASLGVALSLLASSTVASAADSKAAAGKLALPHSAALKHVRASALRGEKNHLHGSSSLPIILIVGALAIGGIVAAATSSNSG